MDIIQKNCYEHPKLIHNNIYRDLTLLSVNNNDKKDFCQVICTMYKTKVDAIVFTESYGYVGYYLADMMELPYLVIRNRITDTPNTLFKYFELNKTYVGIEVYKEALSKISKQSKILIINDILDDGCLMLNICEFFFRSCPCMITLCP